LYIDHVVSRSAYKNSIERKLKSSPIHRYTNQCKHHFKVYGKKTLTKWKEKYSEELNQYNQSIDCRDRDSNKSTKVSSSAD
jgi:hypothetical protein